MANKMENKNGSNDEVSSQYTLTDALRHLATAGMITAAALGIGGCGQDTGKPKPAHESDPAAKVEKNVQESLTSIDNLAKAYDHRATAVETVLANQGAALESAATALKGVDEKAGAAAKDAAAAKGVSEAAMVLADGTAADLAAYKGATDAEIAKVKADGATTVEKVAGLEKSVAEVDQKVVSPLSGRNFTCEGSEYSLRIPAAGNGASVLKGTDVLGMITINQYLKGDADIAVSWETDGVKGFAASETKGGLYDAASAKAKNVELDAIVRSLDVSGKAKDKAAFEAAVLKLQEFGSNPTAGVLDSRAREIVELFRHTQDTGKYVSPGTVAIGEYLSRKDVHVLGTGTTYAVSAGKDALITLTITDKGFDIVDKRITDEAKQTFSVEVPEAYRQEVAAEWAAAYQNGKDAAESSAAEKKKKAESDAKRDEIIKKFDTGVTLSTVVNDDSNHSDRLRISLGGEGQVYTLDAIDQQKKVEQAGETATESLFGGLLRGDLKLGDADLTLELFGQNASGDVKRDGFAPVVEVDETGRFRSTITIDSETEKAERSYGSLLIAPKWTSGTFERFLLYGGKESSDFRQIGDVTVEDLTGIILPFTNHLDTKVMTKVGFGGAESITGFGLGKHLPMLLLGYEQGQINIDDGTLDQKLDFSEFRLGLGYRFLGEDGRLALFGVYSGADVDGEKANGIDISLASAFSIGDYTAMGLRGRWQNTDDSTAEDSNLFGGGLMFAFAGNSKTNMVAMDRYNSESILRDVSKQYTPEMKDALDSYAWNQMIREADASILINLGLSEMYDKDGEKELGGAARLAFLVPTGAASKVSIEPFYSHEADGERFGGDLGFHWKRGFIKAGYEHRGGDLLVNDKDNGHTFTFGLGLNF